MGGLVSLGFTAAEILADAGMFGAGLGEAGAVAAEGAELGTAAATAGEAAAAAGEGSSLGLSGQTIGNTTAAITHGIDAGKDLYNIGQEGMPDYTNYLNVDDITGHQPYPQPKADQFTSLGGVASGGGGPSYY